MKPNVKRELAALAKMTAGQLRQRYADLFGEPSRSGNRQWLFRRCAWRIQALAEGDLSERARRRARELAQDADLRLRPPQREPVEQASGVVQSGALSLAQDERLPMPGTIITRDFKGRRHYVKVLPNGFEYEGQYYRSLSSVAKAITGSHWSGYRFFNLTKETP